MLGKIVSSVVNFFTGKSRKEKLEAERIAKREAVRRELFDRVDSEMLKKAQLMEENKYWARVAAEMKSNREYEVVPRSRISKEEIESWRENNARLEQMYYPMSRQLHSKTSA
jgi:hypothetical protein